VRQTVDAVTDFGSPALAPGKRLPRLTVRLFPICGIYVFLGGGNNYTGRALAAGSGGLGMTREERGAWLKNPTLLKVLRRGGGLVCSIFAALCGIEGASPADTTSPSTPP
jgi:hypothetical protein